MIEMPEICVVIIPTYIRLSNILAAGSPAHAGKNTKSTLQLRCGKTKKAGQNLSAFSSG
jgi:hypothetical protein